MREVTKAALALVIVGLLVGVGGYEYAITPDTRPNASGDVIPVVAAENFWGSLAGLLGGAHVRVTSIVSDPNADPHEYATSTADAVAVSDARLVILNGAGYDAWAAQLLAVGGNPGQKVLDVAALLGKSTGDNPHFWYDPGYVNATVRAIYNALCSLAPSETTYFQEQYGALNASLGATFARATAIRASFHGTPVAATESIFVYLANATGLDLVSPPAFMSAVSQGIDPPAQSVSTFVSQLTGGSVRVLVYNEQTVTPLTQQMQQIATDHQVALVAISETIQPPGESYPVWMSAQLAVLENALGPHAAGA